MWRSKDTYPIHPGKVLGELRSRFSQFRGYDPNDVHEVILCVIDIFEKSIGDEWIKKHFYGKTKNVVTWDNGTSETFELFACKILEQDEQPLSIRETTIQDYIDNNNTVWPKASHKVYIESIGSVFMMSFNMYNDKKDVTLPAEFSFGSNTYRLYSAAIHVGSHLGGHYAAIVCYKGKWFIKDDCTVVEVPNFKPTGPYYFAMYKRLV